MIILKTFLEKIILTYTTILKRKFFFSIKRGYNLILDKSCYNSMLQLITTWADVRLKKNKCDSLRNFSSINIYPEFVSKLYLIQYRSVDYQ
jgi:hypothetical protein